MIDAHIHLQDKRFDADRRVLMRQAKDCGVTGFFCASAVPSDWAEILALAEKNSDIYPFIGTHPQHAAEHDAVLFRQLLQKYPRAGIGEIGLDAAQKDPAQEIVFTDQLQTAAELKRPCVIHCVKSFDQTAAVLKRLKKIPPALMMHGFSGTLQQAEFLLRFNAFFSFSGAVLSENRKKLRSVLAALPADRILAETDAPDMRPNEKFCVIKNEPRNIPANLPLIIRGLAEIRKTDAESFSFVLRQNALRFYEFNLRG